MRRNTRWADSSPVYFFPPSLALSSSATGQKGKRQERIPAWPMTLPRISPPLRSSHVTPLSTHIYTHIFPPLIPPHLPSQNSWGRKLRKKKGRPRRDSICGERGDCFPLTALASLRLWERSTLVPDLGDPRAAPAPEAEAASSLQRKRRGLARLYKRWAEGRENHK